MSGVRLTKIKVNGVGKKALHLFMQTLKKSRISSVVRNDLIPVSNILRAVLKCKLVSRNSVFIIFF